MLSQWFSRRQRRFSSLTEQELLAVAIGAEEEDAKLYRDIVAQLADFPATAQLFQHMAEEEDDHRRALIDLYVTRFGSHIPLLRRSEIAGLVSYPSLWGGGLQIGQMRQLAAQIEGQNRRFYQLAAAQSQDAATRKLLGDLAAAEGAHELQAVAREGAMDEADVGTEADTARRQLVLQVVQPGLAGLLDGSVSTLAPVFAAAMATQDSHATLLVGLAASVGAGISMGLTEGMSDDGKISGRGSPWLRGSVCGIMTTVGGVGHALPYLLTDFWLATTLALVVVVLELLLISYIRWHYMDSPFWRAMVQVFLGGLLVVAVGRARRIRQLKAHRDGQVQQARRLHLLHAGQIVEVGKAEMLEEFVRRAIGHRPSRRPTPPAQPHEPHLQQQVQRPAR
jgi:rubrerythrin